MTYLFVTIGVLVFLYVAFLCISATRGIKIYREGISSSASLNIGSYALGMSIQGIVGLTEFSEDEYRIFGRRFEGETSYNASEVTFLNHQWKTALGTVNGNVYKIAHYFETEHKDTAVIVSSQLKQYLEQRIGLPTDEDKTAYTTVWDKSDGNVIMQIGKVLNTYAINLYQTSSSVKTFAPRR